MNSLCFSCSLSPQGGPSCRCGCSIPRGWVLTNLQLNRFACLKLSPHWGACSGLMCSSSSITHMAPQQTCGQPHGPGKADYGLRSTLWNKCKRLMGGPYTTLPSPSISDCLQTLYGLLGLVSAVQRSMRHWELQLRFWKGIWMVRLHHDVQTIWTWDTAHILQYHSLLAMSLIIFWPWLHHPYFCFAPHCTWIFKRSQISRIGKLHDLMWLSAQDPDFTMRPFPGLSSLSCLILLQLLRSDFTPPRTCYWVLFLTCFHK